MLKEILGLNELGLGLNELVFVKGAVFGVKLAVFCSRSRFWLKEPFLGLKELFLAQGAVFGSCCDSPIPRGVPGSCLVSLGAGPVPSLPAGSPQSRGQGKLLEGS